MLIYNVTINIDDTAHDEWLEWMQKKHIPDMLSTKKFIGATFCKVLVDEEMGGTTYSIQYRVANRNLLNRYYSEDAEKMRAEGARLFANKFVAFRTELQIVNEKAH